MRDDNVGNRVHRGRRYHAHVANARVGKLWRSVEGGIYSRPNHPGFRKTSVISRANRPALIPNGAWPRRMPATLAAGYVGESSVEGFLRRVGKEYPHPRVKEGRRQLWLIDDLDRAIAPNRARVFDIAEEL